jgi:hypothetical protein
VVKCRIQLLRPSDKATSAPRPFEYHPLDPGTKSCAWSQRNTKASYDSFRRILAADSGALLSSIRYSSETEAAVELERASKACQTNLVIPLKEGTTENDNWVDLIDMASLAVNDRSSVARYLFEPPHLVAKACQTLVSVPAGDNWADTSLLGMDDRSNAVTEYFNKLKSFTTEMKQDMESVQNGNFVSNVPSTSGKGNGLSPPPVPPKRKKTQKTQTRTLEGEVNGNQAYPASVVDSNANFGFAPGDYDQIGEVSDFDSDLREKAALYAGSPPLATMSELDDLDALSLYAKMDELSGDSSSQWDTGAVASSDCSVLASPDAANANDPAGSVKLDSVRTDVIAAVASPLSVDDPDYIPLPVLDLFV